MDPKTDEQTFQSFVFLDGQESKGLHRTILWCFVVSITDIHFLLGWYWECSHSARRSGMKWTIIADITYKTVTIVPMQVQNYNLICSQEFNSTAPQVVVSVSFYLSVEYRGQAPCCWLHSKEIHSWRKLGRQARRHALTHTHTCACSLSD